MRIDFEILGMKGFNPGKINLRPRKVIEICFWEKVLTLPLIHELSQEKYERDYLTTAGLCFGFYNYANKQIFVGTGK